jgi:hypothetical protein
MLVNLMFVVTLQQFPNRFPPKTIFGLFDADNTYGLDQLGNRNIQMVKVEINYLFTQLLCTRRSSISAHRCRE